MRKIIIAIDGFSACGKSTTAKLVASLLNYTYIDTGAMYRAVTLYFQNHHISLTNSKAVSYALNKIHISFKCRHHLNDNEIYLNGILIENEIRQMRISNKVSQVSALQEVRKAMVAQQQRIGKKRGVVMDGRDIGTVVFPEAELKIFMNAELEVRVQRRQEELLEKGEMISIEEVKNNLLRRDEIDSNRKQSPLVKAKDSYEIDTTHITVKEQVEKIMQLAMGKMIE